MAGAKGKALWGWLAVAAVVAVVAAVVVMVVRRYRGAGGKEEDKRPAVFSGWWSWWLGGGKSVCERKCGELFAGKGGMTYESACVNSCEAGRGRTPAERCEYCGSQATPMSGYNLTCQRYVGLSDPDWEDDETGERYSRECCGTGGLAGFKAMC